MQVEVRDKNNYTRLLTVQVDSGELREVENRVIKKLKNSTTLPGFRKGRVPVGILKKRYADTIKLEVMEDSVSEYYTRALQDSDIHPVSQGKINKIDFEDVESGMTFEIEIEVEPEIELKKYKGLKVEREVPVVTDQMVEDTLNMLREQYAISKEAGEVKEGFYVTINAQKLGEGDVAVVGQKFEDVMIKVGSGEFNLDFEKQLIGLKKEQEAVVRISSMPPATVKNPQPVVESFRVIVKSIEERELPPLDDEFAKTLPESDLDTLEQLKERIRNNLKFDLEQRSSEQFVNRLVDELLKENSFDVPPGMIDHYLDHLVEDIKNQSKDKDSKNINEEEIRKNYRAQAIHNIRWFLLRDKLIEVENIHVDDSEIDEAINTMNMNDQEKKKVKKDVRLRERIKDNLLEQKVIKMLETNTDVIEIYPQAENLNLKA
ncbi:MAG: trigger factor [Calditrichia bacterium]